MRHLVAFLSFCILLKWNHKALFHLRNEEPPHKDASSFSLWTKTHILIRERSISCESREQVVCIQHHSTSKLWFTDIISNCRLHLSLYTVCSGAGGVCAQWDCTENVEVSRLACLINWRQPVFFPNSICEVYLCVHRKGDKVMLFNCQGQR